MGHQSRSGAVQGEVEILDLEEENKIQPAIAILIIQS
jgi:hypothetical protein